MGQLAGCGASPARTRGAAPRGFTLVELLVAVTIVAVASAIAVVAWRGNPRADAGREARRLAGALEYAAERAQWRRETLGVRSDAAGWSFLRRSEAATWQPVIDDDTLAPHRLPAPLTLHAARYAGQPVAPGTVIPLLASGRNEPFSFVVDGGDAPIAVTVDPLNRVSIGVPP